MRPITTAVEVPIELLKLSGDQYLAITRVASDAHDHDVTILGLEYPGDGPWLGGIAPYGAGAYTLLKPLSYLSPADVASIEADAIASVEDAPEDPRERGDDDGTEYGDPRDRDWS